MVTSGSCSPVVQIEGIYSWQSGRAMVARKVRRTRRMLLEILRKNKTTQNNGIRKVTNGCTTESFKSCNRTLSHTPTSIEKVIDIGEPPPRLYSSYTITIPNVWWCNTVFFFFCFPVNANNNQVIVIAFQITNLALTHEGIVLVHILSATVRHQEEDTFNVAVNFKSWLQEEEEP